MSVSPTTFGTLHFDTLANEAVTAWFAFIVSAHVPVPEQLPDQPVNFEPKAAAAVSVTAVPSLYCAVQAAPHEIPAGELVTVPEPDPALLTVSVRSATNVAVTVVSALSVTVHEAVPEHPPPDQPAKTEPGSAAALSVTEVPCAHWKRQVDPQVTPAGFEVIEPEPLPVLAAVSRLTAHDGNLKLPIRVRQLNWLVVA